MVYVERQKSNVFTLFVFCLSMGVGGGGTTTFCPARSCEVLSLGKRYPLYCSGSLSEYCSDRTGYPLSLTLTTSPSPGSIRCTAGGKPFAVMQEHVLVLLMFEVRYFQFSKRTSYSPYFNDHCLFSEGRN